MLKPREKRTSSNFQKRTMKNSLLTISEDTIYGIVEGGLWALRLIKPDEQVVNLELVPKGFLVTTQPSATSFEKPNYNKGN